ncbi:MAG: S1 family peptidase [Parachlamydiaceae bacterium]
MFNSSLIQPQQCLIPVDRNPFDVGNNEIRQLTPRRKRYIQARNVAQDQRISSIAESIHDYKVVIDEVRERYKASEPEDQCLIKPYLTILYFELGQLFEEQKQPQVALIYYEQAGIYGHSISIAHAKRLGSKCRFVSIEEADARKPVTSRSSPIDKLALVKALHEMIVLIEGDARKGSGVLAKHETLGNVLITVKHVVTPGAIAYVKGKAIFLDTLVKHDIGPNTLFVLNDLHEPESTVFSRVLAYGKLQIGEKVYFGGYPFKKMDAYLHMGHVSSLGKNGEMSIDGVAVPGMSGGPIAVEREGNLYIVGTIASETFDPIEGFSEALEKMYIDQSDIQSQYDWAQEMKQRAVEEIRENPQFTKITRGSLYIADLDGLRDMDPLCFVKMWDDLNKQGVLSDDGGIDPSKITPGQLGLRKEYQQYEKFLINRLAASSTSLASMDPSKINLPFAWQTPTDSVNTVGLSLVQSLSTGVITGNLFQGLPEITFNAMESKTESLDSAATDAQETTEFEIGRENRFNKNTKKIRKEARLLREEAKLAGTFKNNGTPPILYRFVSKEDAKHIKKNGIEHVGNDLDEIPFLTKPDIRMARSVGAVSTGKIVAIYTDKIPNLKTENVRKASERQTVITYRINTSIPKEAIEIVGE